MDVKKTRFRNDRNIADSYPGNEQALGTSSCDANMNWYARSSSWQGNSNTDFKSIQKENEEQAQRWGVPWQDNLPNPADSNNNTDDPLPNPHNFSSNPGYMGTSTASMLTAAAPGNGTTGTIRRAGAPGSTTMPANSATLGRSTKSTKGNINLPAPGDTDPRSEGGPQMMTSGFSGG